MYSISLYNRLNIPKAFSEARARAQLSSLVQIGPRVTGTPPNEIDGRGWLLQELSKIEPPSNATELEVSPMLASGLIDAYFNPYTIDAYSGITNIVVRVSNGTPKSKRNALLVSGHFDTVPFSPGAGDDGSAIVVMLELIRALVYQDASLFDETSVIFNLNGAEEVGLLGSHAFITQHPWAPTVRAFINMDANGIGGKAMLFQAGPYNHWLVEAYARSAVHPFANSLDLFQSGLFPFDTDYRIYRDFGFIPGLDFAFIRNGYAYHTYLDNIQRVTLGSLQQEGENDFGLIKDILSQDLLTSPVEQDNGYGSSIYYDFLGLGVATYTGTASFWLNASVFILSAIILVVFIITSMCFFGYDSTALVDIAVNIILSFFVLILGCALALGFSAFIGLLMSYINPSSWYANPMLSFALYGFYAPLGLLLAQWAFRVYSRKQRPDLSNVDMQRYSFWATHIFWIILLVTATTARASVAYYAFYWCLFPVSIFLISLATRKGLRKWYEAKKRRDRLHKISSENSVSPDHRVAFVKKMLHKLRKYLVLDSWWIEVILQLVIPTIITMYGGITLILTIIPMTASIHGVAGDVILAVLVTSCTLLVVSFFVPNMYRVGNYGKTNAVLAMGCVLSFLVACFLFPYAVERPLKITSTHYYNTNTSDSHILIKLASTPPFNKALINIDNAVEQSDGTFIISNVSRPHIADPYVTMRTNPAGWAELHVHTLNATSWSLFLQASAPITAIQIVNVTAKNIVANDDGHYIIKHQFGLQVINQHVADVLFC